VNLLQIAPRLPPEIDGVGDYAARLGEELSAKGWKSEFLARKDFETGNDVLGKKNPDVILLHYVGYGFHKRGIPFAFINLLLEKQAQLRAPLVVVFHEIWSSSAPWRTPFYLHLFQRSLVRRLARAASAVITSTGRMQRLLEGYAKNGVELLPIPSSIPAVKEMKQKASGGLLNVCVFGLPGSRAKTLEVHRDLLRELHRSKRLRKLILIGPGKGEMGENVLDERLPRSMMEQTGELSPGEVSGALAESDLLLSNYPGDLLTKSSTAMAAFACGCPVAIGSASVGGELKDGKHFLSAEKVMENNALLMADNLERVAKEALAWYQKNASWTVVSEKFDTILLSVSGLEKGAVLRDRSSPWPSPLKERETVATGKAS
jgi:glycosyltransferase involved in cell wall biosynthesis